MFASAAPFRNGYGRPFIELGCNIEFIHQPPRTSQPETHTIATREPIRHCLINVAYSWSLVREHEPQALPGAIIYSLHAEVSAAPIVDRVARDLACCRDNLGLVDDAEAKFCRHLAHRSAHRDDIFRGSDRQSLRLENFHPPTPPLPPLRFPVWHGRHRREESPCRVRR